MNHRPLLRLLSLMLTVLLTMPLLAASPVNINTADAATLVEGLQGIGRAKAEAIVAWRQAHGPFKSLDELEQVKGIGPSILQRNRDAIAFGAAKAKPSGKSPATARPRPGKAGKASTDRSPRPTPAGG